MDWLALASSVHAVVEQAGELAARQFRPGARTASQVWYKAGGSPVTAADIAANDLLQDRLRPLLPQAAWLSEETADNKARLAQRLVWIVDPIDGTRAFLSGHPDWCVSVALVADGVPVIGSLLAPALGLHYRAVRGAGASRNGSAIRVSRRGSLEGSRIAGPHPLVERLEVRTRATLRVGKVPSLALRLARVADGSIDIGLVSGRAHDWDIAAADLILQESEGVITGLRDEPVCYNSADPTHGELAASSKLLHSSVIGAFA